MLAYLRNPLTIVWGLLTAVTLVSWSTARDGGSGHVLDSTVTVIVLMLAAMKSVLVIWHFMEVGHAPRWLKVTAGSWAVVLFALLLGCYFYRG